MLPVKLLFSLSPSLSSLQDFRYRQRIVLRLDIITLYLIKYSVKNILSTLSLQVL